MVTQATARTSSYGGVAGESNHGGEGLKATLGMSDDREPMDWNGAECHCGSGIPEGRGGVIGSVAGCRARGSTQGPRWICATDSRLRGN